MPNNVVEQRVGVDSIKHRAIEKLFPNIFQNIVVENDLRTLMPSIYGGEYKTFKKGYIMMQCPFHNDSNPSMIVKKEFYYCKACGEKGNWWNLREKGVVDFEDEEYIRVGKNKELRGDV